MEEKLAYEIGISQDKMQAFLSFERVQEGLKPEDIIKDLEKLGIKHGIKEDKIRQILEDYSLFTDYVVAQGLKPTKPFPGEVEYFFQTVKDVKPAIDQAGNVDYKNLSLISNVKQGQLLARLKPAVAGEPGMNLMGTLLAPPQVKAKTIKAGKNTLFNENKTALFAGKDGMALLQDGYIQVSDVYQVPNHVGTSTGNVHFEGSVVVAGNVLTGFTVEAKGNIEVFGVVEGATLKAGGNIILHSGVTGMGRAVVEAQGSLLTKYIEQAKVRVHGDLHSGAILHSTVFCGGSILVEGRKALISGGKIIGATYVESLVVGSNMGTVTEVEVGLNPLLAEEYRELSQNLPKVKHELEQMEKIISLLNKRREISGSLEEDKQEMYVTAIKNKIVLASRYQQMEKDLEKLEAEMAGSASGQIVARATMYAGTRLTINHVSRTISDDLKAVKFVREGADLKMLSL